MPGSSPIKFLECPICHSIVSFCIPQKIQDRYEASKLQRSRGIVLYGQDRQVTPFLINFHYFIINDRIDLVMHEENTDHMIYILIDSHYDVRDSYAVYDHDLISYYSKKLKREIKPEEVEKLIGAVYWDELYQHAVV